MLYLKKYSRFLPAYSVGGLALIAVLAGPEIAKADCEPDPYIGSICITAASYCPRQYTEMRGQTMDANTYPALFSVVGFTYGGNGQSTFGLPYGQGRTLISQGRGPGLEYYPLGAYDGVEKRSIGLHQLPPHTHGATFVPGSAANVAQQVATLPGSLDQPSAGDYKGATKKGSASVAAYVGSADAGATVNLGGVETTISTSVPSTLSTTGVQNPGLDTIQPQMGLRYCVAYDGTYPPRP